MGTCSYWSLHRRAAPVSGKSHQNAGCLGHWDRGRPSTAASEWATKPACGGNGYHVPVLPERILMARAARWHRDHAILCRENRMDVFD